MPLTVNDVLGQLHRDIDDASSQDMELYLLSATSIAQKLIGNNFDPENRQVQLVIILFCDYFTNPNTDNQKVMSGDFLPESIRCALSGIYVPLCI